MPVSSDWRCSAVLVYLLKQCCWFDVCRHCFVFIRYTGVEEPAESQLDIPSACSLRCHVVDHGRIRPVGDFSWLGPMLSFPSVI